MRESSSPCHLLVFVHSHVTKRSQGHYSSCSLCVCVLVFANHNEDYLRVRVLSVTVIPVGKKKKT